MFFKSSESDIDIIVARFDSFLQVSLATMYFSSIENFFRIIGKKLYPKIFDERTHISIIYKKILEDFDLKNYNCVFDMYRLIRNSMHDNGIYNNKEQKFYYNNEIYHFKPNEFILINWLLLCNLSIDLESCIFKIIKTKKVSSFDLIKDPSSYYPYLIF